MSPLIKLDSFHPIFAKYIIYVILVKVIGTNVKYFTILDKNPHPKG